MLVNRARQSAGKPSAQLRNPDDLDRYVQVTGPGVWMLLAAAIALLVGLLAWGVFGSVSTRVSATAVRDRDSIRCFLAPSDVARVRPGNMAYVGNEQMEVAGVDVTPYSREEVSELLGRDYLTDAVMREDWTYLVVLKGDGDYDFIEGVPLSVAITTDRVAPITLVLDR